jgi:glyoxylase-like metal-dependent hydrolase (beta-lactamase superfamily II)
MNRPAQKSLLAVIATAFMTLALTTSIAHAAGGKVTSPTGTAPDRYVYYPGTESLDKGEIRLFACGTGMPAARRDQAATCWLVETGNGDKFLFDIGTGSMVNVAALMIPYDFLDKVFITHLHTDHWGDRRAFPQDLQLGCPDTQLRSQPRARQDYRHRVRLYRRERGGLPGRRRHHPFHTGDPCRRRPGQFHP